MKRAHRSTLLSQCEIIARDQGIAARRKRVLDWVRACQSPPPTTDPRTDSVIFKVFCPFHRNRKPTATFTVRDEFDPWPSFFCSACWADTHQFTRHIEQLSSLETA